MTDDEFTDRVRSMVMHENNLRDQKLNWLIASQGFLIAALGFSWEKDKYLVISLAIVGLLFCVSIGASLFVNTLAIRKLANNWKKTFPSYAGPGVSALRSREISPHLLTQLYPWNVIPAALSVFWIFVLCYKLLVKA